MTKRKAKGYKKAKKKREELSFKILKTVRERDKKQEGEQDQEHRVW